MVLGMIFDDFELEIIKISNGDMTTLGLAAGSKQHCEQWVLRKLVKKLPILLSKLISLGHSQFFFYFCYIALFFVKWYGSFAPSLQPDFRCL